MHNLPNEMNEKKIALTFVIELDDIFSIEVNWRVSRRNGRFESILISNRF